MREKDRNPIERVNKFPQFITMNVIDGQAGLIIYFSLILCSLTINNILNIIVLLILAGVTISMLTGDSGILSNAEKAKEATRLGNIKEELQLWQATALMDEYINTEVESTDELLERLEKQKTISKEEKEKLASGESITVNGEEISLAKITAGIKVGDLLNASNKVI